MQNTKARRNVSCLLGGVLALALAGCGGGGPGTPPPPTPPPAPNAAVTATPAGTIVLHLSAVPDWLYALEIPVRLQETGGGTADWNYARLSLLIGGVEVERAEIGSDIIRQGGGGRVNPRSDASYSLTFRLNSDFEDARLELGFTDVNHLNMFTTEASGFACCDISPVPAFVPDGGALSINAR